MDISRAGVGMLRPGRTSHMTTPPPVIRLHPEGGVVIARATLLPGTSVGDNVVADSCPKYRVVFDQKDSHRRDIPIPIPIYVHEACRKADGNIRPPSATRQD